MQVVILVVLLFALSSNVFAATYTNPGVIVGPASSDPEAVKLDEVNYAYQSISKMMSKDDKYKALFYISEYRKGDKDAEKNLINIIAKYNANHAEFIVEYILRGNNTQLLTSYVIEHTFNTPIYVKVEGLTGDPNADITETGIKTWNKICESVPEEFYNAIDRMYLELYKPNDSTITICEIDGEATKYAIYIDCRILNEDHDEEYWKQIIYNTVYYYILRNDQVADALLNLGDNGVTKRIKKENYSYGVHYYRDDAYIDIFYKRWWKGRRKEINLGQVSLYPNDFLNSKSSKSVYEDMAVSFYANLMGIRNNNTEVIKYKKIDFFDNFEIFSKLKLFFKYKLGL